MSINFTDVDEILRIIDQFPAAEIRFEHGDLKLYVKRANSDGAAQSAPAPPAAGPAAAATAAVAPPAAARSSKSKSSATKKDRAGQIAIESPLIGVYYAAPAPDAEPFVKKGDKVARGTDLCIIEVMKVMNTIKAPCAGVVVEIIAENGTMVEQGQALMLIKPTGETYDNGTAIGA